MFPIASVKFLAAHEPDSSMPSGFDRPWARIRALVAATTTIAERIIRHTVASSARHPKKRVTIPTNMASDPTRMHPAVS